MAGSIRFPLTSLGVATTVMLLSASSPRAQGDDEEEFDRTPHKCLTTSRIRDTDILDDRTIIFYLRGNREVYRTYLPRECPGLARNDRFAYRLPGGQLCSLDTITVLEQFGSQLHETVTCRLGEFIPITREEAEDLELEKQGEGGKRDAISSERAELPDAAEQTQDAAAADPAIPDDPAAADAAAAAGETPDAAPPKAKRRQRGSGVTAR